jgi:hypothetical protein
LVHTPLAFDRTPAADATLIESRPVIAATRSAETRMRFQLLSLPVRARLARVGSCLILASACTTLRPLTPDDLGDKRAESVHVTLADHSTVVMHTPQVIGDTLVGTVNGAREGFPLSQVTAIRDREFDWVHTGILITVGAMGGLAVFAIQHGNGLPSSTARCGSGILTSNC